MVIGNITVGMQLAATVTIFVLGGYWLDGRYGKSPLLTTIGAALGLVIGFYQLIKELDAMKKRDKENRDKKRIKWM